MDYRKTLEQSDEFYIWEGAQLKEIESAEMQLGVVFPQHYFDFLYQCGMCNYGDTTILGIAKNNKKISFPVVETTLEMRKEVMIPNDYIVLRYEVGEFLILHKVSLTGSERMADAPIYGASVLYNQEQIPRIGVFKELFTSFDIFFSNFSQLSEDDDL